MRAKVRVALKKERARHGKMSVSMRTTISTGGLNKP